VLGVVCVSVVQVISMKYSKEYEGGLVAEGWNRRERVAF